jgi:hypothetical protein
MKHDSKVIDDIKSSEKLKEEFQHLLGCFLRNELLEDVYYEAFIKGEVND